MGPHIFESSSAGGGWSAGAGRVDREVVGGLLAGLGFDTGLADALQDPSLDAGLRAETDEALALTGKDARTPIIDVQPPGGVVFSGPVISRLPSRQDAVRLGDHVVGLVGSPGVRRAQAQPAREPQLPASGVAADQVGVREDRHGGSRRQKKGGRPTRSRSPRLWWSAPRPSCARTCAATSPLPARSARSPAPMGGTTAPAQEFAFIVGGTFLRWGFTSRARRAPG